MTLDLGEAMAGWNAMSAGARGAVAVAGAAVVAVAGYFGLARGPEAVAVQPAALETGAVETGAVQTGAEASGAAPGATAPAAAAPEAVALAAEAPVAATPAAPATVTEPAADTGVQEVVEAEPVAPSPVPDVGAAAAILPSFDVARVAADGAATVAGVAAPGAAVKVMVDGVEVARATADAQGKFAALFDVPAGETARMLSLEAIGVDGGIVPGADTVALAPIVAAVVDSPALQAPPAVLVAPEGVKVLQSGADVPAVVAGQVAVDTISYAPDGAVLLGGRAMAGAALRIYLNGAAIADVTTGADGAWATGLEDVAAGIYTLRVDQLSADGKVTSRFETPFKRETLEALAAAAETSGQAQETVGEAATEMGGVTVADATAEPAATAPEAAVGASEPLAAATAASDVAAAEETEAAETEPAAQMAAASPVPASAPVTVTVQPGYTLWGIAQQNFGDGVMYVQVFEANKAKIKDPDLIYPGQVFTIPSAGPAAP